MQLLVHKRAHHDYEFIENFEAGLQLTGSEVKTIRSKRGILEGNKVIIRGGEAFVVGMQIPLYQAENQHTQIDLSRTRKLLLHKSELAKCSSWESEKGHNILITEIYLTRNILKAKLVLAKKKSKEDKRDDIRKKDTALRAKKAGSTKWYDYE